MELWGHLLLLGVLRCQSCGSIIRVLWLCSSSSVSLLRRGAIAHSRVLLRLLWKVVLLLGLAWQGGGCSCSRHHTHHSRVVEVHGRG